MNNNTSMSEFEDICKKCGLYTDGSDSVAEIVRLLIGSREKISKENEELKKKILELEEKIDKSIKSGFKDIAENMNIEMDSATLTMNIDYKILAEEIAKNLK